MAVFRVPSASPESSPSVRGSPLRYRVPSASSSSSSSRSRGSNIPNRPRRGSRSPAGSPRGFKVTSRSNTPSSLSSDGSFKEDERRSSSPRTTPERSSPIVRQTPRVNYAPGAWPPGVTPPIIQRRPDRPLSLSPVRVEKQSPTRNRKVRPRSRVELSHGTLSLPTSREQPGEKPVFAVERTKDGTKKVNWTDGWVWMHYKALPGGPPFVERFPCRQVIDDNEELETEVAMDVGDLLNHPNLVQLLEYDDTDGPGTLRRTKWEYCNAGTLNQLILAQDREGLPESLIWHTIISLLRASTYLITGNQALTVNQCCSSDDLEPIQGWKPISHNFINPANIFYCHPEQEAGYKELTYGTCKLGNFAKCTVFKDWNDKRNLFELWDQDLEGVYTGYEAPELSSHWSQAEITPGGLGDVWSIGACAVAMMTGQSIWELVMDENITPQLMSRRDEDWRTVVPTERFEQLAAMCRPDVPPGCTTLQQALPFTYWPVLRSIVEQMVIPGQYRPPPEFLLPQVMEELALHRERAEGLTLRALDEVTDQLIDAQADLQIALEAGDAEKGRRLRFDTIPLLEERLATGVQGKDIYGPAKDYVFELEMEDDVGG